MLLVVVLVVLAVALVLVGGGIVASSRRRAHGRAALLRRAAEADAALAAARAEDQGWDPAALEAAARTAFARDRPGAEPTSLLLVQVVDRPGVEHDEARMRVTDAVGEAVEVPLTRGPDGTWAG